MAPPFDAASLASALAEVQQTRAQLAGSPSLLLKPYGIGEDLSDWQVAWLIADRAATDEQALAELRARFDYGDALDAFGIFILASASLEQARARVALAAKESWKERLSNDDRSAWVRFFAGAESLPKDGATSRHYFEVVGALNGDWAEVDRRLPKRVRRDYPRAIRVGPDEVMREQLMRQLWMHHRRGKPIAAVLRASLQSLFTHWGRRTSDDRYSGRAVAARLPFVGLVAAVTKEEPLALFYEQRQWNQHLMSPPPRTFTVPEDVDDALAAYESVLARVVATGKSFQRTSGVGADLSLVAVD
jgi:hypothetical protein